jgi:hypothetical protein
LESIWTNMRIGNLKLQFLQRESDAVLSTNVRVTYELKDGTVEDYGIFNFGNNNDNLIFPDVTYNGKDYVTITEDKS